MNNKLPALQFYPGDWRKDPGVQSLSYFDRGVWFEMLCLMHESAERGRLLLNGSPMPDEALARLLGLDNQILTKTLETLLVYGVATRDEDGALVNRRMVRDEYLRQIRTESGKKGGNPNLLNQNSTNGTSKVQPKRQIEVNQKSTPSSSSSTSSSDKKKSATRASSTAEEFFEKLKSNPAYSHVDLDREFAKADQWCETNSRKNTQRFFVNWINRIDPPLNGNGRRRVETFAAPDIEPPVIRNLVPLRPAEKVPVEHKQLWQSVTDRLRKQLAPDVYRSWFDNVVFDGLDVERSAFKVRAFPMTHEWITRYYAELIYETLIAAGLAEFTLDWTVEEETFAEATS